MKSIIRNPTLNTHYLILTQSTTFANQIMYSLNCILSEIRHSNSNRDANLSEMQNWTPDLLFLMKTHKKDEIHFLCIQLLNHIHKITASERA